MSKVKLVIAEEYTNPFTVKADVIEIDLKIPDTHKIIGVVHPDLDPDNAGVRTVTDHAPVIWTTGFNHLVGKLLTLVDAALNNQEQQKALKDLVRQTSWDWYWGNSSTPVSAWGKGKDISV